MFIRVSMGNQARLDREGLVEQLYVIHRLALFVFLAFILIFLIHVGKQWVPRATWN